MKRYILTVKLVKACWHQFGSWIKRLNGWLRERVLQFYRADGGDFGLRQQAQIHGGRSSNLNNGTLMAAWLESSSVGGGGEEATMLLGGEASLRGTLRDA